MEFPGAVSLFKVYLNASSKGDTDKVVNLPAPEPEDAILRKLGLAREVAAACLQTYQENQNFLRSAGELAVLQAKYAYAQSHDYQAEIERVQLRLKTLESDVAYLERFVGQTLGTTPSTTAPEVLPDGGGDAEGDSLFMDVVITSQTVEERASSSSQSQSSSSSWNVSAWFFSAGGQSSSASSASAIESASFNSEFEIGFRAAKVSIDRGGWFNPSMFAMS